MCVHACVHACVHLLTFSLKKTSPQKLLTGLLPNFIVAFLRYRLKSSLHRYRKIRPGERYRRSSASTCQISQECVFEVKKLLFTITEKSGLWSDTGAQAPLVTYLQYKSVEYNVGKGDIVPS